MPQNSLKLHMPFLKGGAWGSCLIRLTQYPLLHITPLLMDLNEIPTVVIRLQMLVNIIPTLITHFQMLLNKVLTHTTRLQMLLC